MSMVDPRPELDDAALEALAEHPDDREANVKLMRALLTFTKTNEDAFEALVVTLGEMRWMMHRYKSALGAIRQVDLSSYGKAHDIASEALGVPAESRQEEQAKAGEVMADLIIPRRRRR